MPLYYIQRKTGEIKEETVAGDAFLRWIYDTKTGGLILHSLVKRKIFSYLYGRFQDTALSRRKIKSFVRTMKIDMTEAENENLDSYRTFNDFFTRKLKKSSRPVDSRPEILVSPADGKILAWENINSSKLIQVKGSNYSLADLLQDKDLAEKFHEGSCLTIRLCPADYHRFHFPDHGIPAKTVKIGGHYYSVNPRALSKIPRLYCENKRELTLFRSENFGQMIIMEIGATCVGSIIQTYTPEQYVRKGEEKGFFKFGGSTIILLLQKNFLKIDNDILDNTKNGIETGILMGEKIGKKIDD